MKNFFLFLAIAFLPVHAHIMIIPYPYYNREYPINTTQCINFNGFQFNNNASLFCQKKYEYLFTTVLFTRTASRGYDIYGKNRNVSAIFHGSSSFELSDLNDNGQTILISNKNNAYKDLLKDYQYIRYEGNVDPEYHLTEKGIMLGFDITSAYKDTINIALQVRLPFISRNIYHQNNWNDIKYTNHAINDTRVTLEPYNKYFQVRSDYLLEKDIINNFRNTNGTTTSGVFFTTNPSEEYFLEKKSYSSNDIYRNNTPFTDTHETVFALTEFDDFAKPTPDSLALFEELSAMTEQDNQELYLNTTKGKYLGKNFSWHTIQQNYFAPLDIQCNIERSFFNEKTLFHGLLAFVIPIKSTEQKEDNYLEKSILKDQYAIRIGTQASFDINTYYKLVCYGSWQYNFPMMQTIPAIFDKQTAYGLTPLYLSGKVSWTDIYLAGHLVITYNQYFGGDIGYQYIKKNGDTVVPECSTFYTISGEQKPLNYEPWKKFSTSVANLFSINIYASIYDWQCKTELKTLITGKNIMQIQEFSLQIIGFF